MAQAINTDYEGEMLMDSTRVLRSHLATERKVERERERQRHDRKWTLLCSVQTHG